MGFKISEQDVEDLIASKENTIERVLNMIITFVKHI